MPSKEKPYRKGAGGNLCPYCSGNGHIFVKRTDEKGKSRTVKETCKHCKGTKKK